MVVRYVKHLILMRWQREGLYLKTPTPYPLCAPARFSMMSGQLPSRIGAFDNGAEFTSATPTFAHYLRLLGYYTSISGKMHFVGPDQYHGYEERLTTEIYPADFSWTPVAGYQDPLLDQERSYTVGVSTIETVLDAGPLARSMQIDYDDEVTHCAVRELFTRARSSDKRPFMLTVSLTHPHDPYVTRQEYWDRYNDDEIDMPKTGFVPLDERDPHSRSLYYHYGQDKTAIDADACRNARHGYYGMISYIDDLFGEVMTALDETGFADNTAVVFTSDHGDMMGERGMWFKKTLFEPAIRIPLIIARPGQTGSRSTAPASLVDKARDQMATLYRAMNSLESGKFVQKIKYGCELQGTPVGHCRQPLLPLTDAEKDEFRSAMEPILNW